MSLFKSIFGKSEDDVKLHQMWTEITSLSDIDVILETSKTQTVAVFKHSTRCSISRRVLSQFEKTNESKAIKFYYLDLLNHRDISNEIANKFDIVHQSPQLIVLKDEQVILSASHSDILNTDF